MKYMTHWMFSQESTTGIRAIRRDLRRWDGRIVTANVG